MSNWLIEANCGNGEYSCAEHTYQCAHTWGQNNKLKFRATVEPSKQNLAIDETPVGRPSFCLPLAMESVPQFSGACPKTGFAFGFRLPAQDPAATLGKIMFFNGIQ